MNVMGGPSLGFRVTPAEATDSLDAQIPEPEPSAETSAGKSEEGPAAATWPQTRETPNSYQRGETFEGEIP